MKVGTAVDLEERQRAEEPPAEGRVGRRRGSEGRAGGFVYRAPLALFVFPVLAAILCPLGVEAQDFSEPLLPAGRLRVGVNSIFRFADTRFGYRMEDGSLIEEDEPLGLDFEDSAVGTRLFPSMEELEAQLSTATGTAVAPQVLGSTRAVLTKDAVWLPVRLDLGVLDWLTVGATFPFSRRRAEFATSIQTDGANVGTPPATSGDFLGEVGVANDALELIATSLCTMDPSSPECAQTTTLLAEGQGFHSALTRGYTDHGVFPLDGSGTGDDLQVRTTSLMNAYQTAGVPGFPAAIPLSTEVLDEATYLDLVSNPNLRVQGDSLQTWRSPWELGDVEVHAYARLWGIGQPTAPDEPQPTVQADIGAGVLFRFGTGRVDSPWNFIDTGSGDGQNDIELSVFGTLSAGNWFGVVADFRYGIQQSGDVLKRITAPDRIFAPRVPTQEVVRWSPGDYAQLRVSPRFYLTGEVALAFDVRYYQKKSDGYSLADPIAGLDPGLLELETEQTTLGVGGGVVYSTAHGGQGRPVEARFLIHQAVSGSGGATPKTTRFEVGLRFYGGLWD